MSLPIGHPLACALRQSIEERDRLALTASRMEGAIELALRSADHLDKDGIVNLLKTALSMAPQEARSAAAELAELRGQNARLNTRVRLWEESRCLLN